MFTLWQLSQGHPKSAFSEKVQREDEGKFFKNRPKSSFRLKGPKALLRKWHYSLICMHLNCKDWRRFWGKQAAPKVPESPSYGNLGKVTQKPYFLKKCKRGTKTNFSKIAQKLPLAWKAQKHSGANCILLYLVCTSSTKIGEDFDAENGSKSARMTKLWQILQSQPIPAFSKKVKSGDQRKFFKNRLKSSPHLKGLEAL